MGQPSLQQRAQAEVERRLAAYTPVETEPQAEAELRRLIRSGMTSDRALPEIPPPPIAKSRPMQEGERRERRRRRVRA
jgi:hypothetical protein